MEETMSQAELAQLMGVDRTTIGRWQREGLPYSRGERGCDNRYQPGVAIHWAVGRRLAEGRQLSPLQYVLLGLAAGYGTASRREWAAQTGVLGAAMDATSEEVVAAVGFLEGAGLLPW